MSKRPKEDALDAHTRAANVLYHVDPPTPLPTRPGEFYSSFAAQQAQKHSAEVFEKTGTKLDVNSYRFLDDLPAALAEPLIDSDVSQKLAAVRVSDDPDGDDIALDQRIAADTLETRGRLIARYGEKDAAQLLERTKRFVRSKPALARIVNQRGVGSKPEIVEELVAYVFSNGIR